LAEIPIFEENPQKGPETPVPEPRRGLLLHQPLAAGPCTRPRGQKGGFSGTPPGRGGFWGPEDPLGSPRDLVWEPRLRRRRRAPARGVDVKPPSAGGLGTDPRGPGPQDPGSGHLALQGRGLRRPRSRIRDPGPVREVWKGLPGAPGAQRPPARGLFYINPSRRGPVPGLASQSRPGTGARSTRSSRPPRPRG